LDVFDFRLRDSIGSALARLPHRLGERVHPSVHVALRRRDLCVTREHLQFVHRDAIVGNRDNAS
jgi:hypothetical protein